MNYSVSLLLGSSLDSYSIKYVLSSLVPELSYKDLEIQNGGIGYEYLREYDEGAYEGDEVATRTALLEIL